MTPDLNYIFRLFAIARHNDESQWEAVRDCLRSTIEKQQEELEPLFEDLVSLDLEEYLEKLEVQSVDPRFELGLMLALPANSANLRLAYVDGDQVAEEVIRVSDQYEFVNFIFCGKKIDILQEKASPEQTQAEEHTLNTVFEASEEDDSKRMLSSAEVSTGAV